MKTTIQINKKLIKAVKDLNLQDSGEKEIENAWHLDNSQCVVIRTSNETLDFELKKFKPNESQNFNAIDNLITEGKEKGKAILLSKEFLIDCLKAILYSGGRNIKLTIIDENHPIILDDKETQIAIAPRIEEFD